MVAYLVASRLTSRLGIDLCVVLAVALAAAMGFSRICSSRSCGCGAAAFGSAAPVLTRSMGRRFELRFVSAGLGDPGCMGTEIIRSRCGVEPALVGTVALTRPRRATRTFVTSLRVA